ncbi:MAG: dTDP-4-dehydrorhamnose reductase [Alphaproteobacteria bacterium]|nr:dTDP-4-dehydrorhamnose reductase [Alphaproteobacteria bacterium]
MTILLLGANGQVGWELRRALAPLGPVRALERAEADLADPDALSRAVRETAPSLIVNAAAYTAVDRAEEDEALARTINADAPGLLAEEAKRLGIALVHYSTDYVFDGVGELPAMESDLTDPLNAYGRTKLAGEAAIRDSGCAHLILRTSWVYSMRGANFLLTVRRLAGELEEMRIVADQTGAPTWARGIAGATALILARCGAPADTGILAEKGGIYNLTASGETTWHGFAEAIVEWLRATGQPVRCKKVHPISTSDYPTPAKRPANSLLDCTKLRETFGITIPDWRDQMDLCVDR